MQLKMKLSVRRLPPAISGTDIMEDKHLLWIVTAEEIAWSKDNFFKKEKDEEKL